MRYKSTRGLSPEVSAFDAIIQGLAPDGGLYIPKELPRLDSAVFDPNLSYTSVAKLVLAPFFAGDPLEAEIPSLCDEAFNFPVPLHFLSPTKAVLELYHGPTAAFKDFGARFLAGFMERAFSIRKSPMMILVATSGDTGGAVASAFYGKKHIEVKVLFPKGRVSARQEKQLTCWGGNVSSYSVRGAFDDCQTMVKQAFMDPELKRQYGLTSANSINLGRLLPQSIYYIYASIRYQHQCGEKPVIIIPSGNVGNAVGAFWAKEMGAPIQKIVLAVNENRTIPDFLSTGVYEARDSIATIANAMDVGDPSNMERLRFLYHDMETMRSNVSAFSVSDDRIRDTIAAVWDDYGYAVCPHTAAGEYVRRHHVASEHTVVVATAHPAKFETIVEPVIQTELPIPESLEKLLHKESRYTEIDPEVSALFSV